MKNLLAVLSTILLFCIIRSSHVIVDSDLFIPLLNTKFFIASGRNPRLLSATIVVSLGSSHPIYSPLFTSSLIFLPDASTPTTLNLAYSYMSVISNPSISCIYLCNSFRISNSFPLILFVSLKYPSMMEF